MALRHIDSTSHVLWANDSLNVTLICVVAYQHMTYLYGRPV